MNMFHTPILIDIVVLTLNRTNTLKKKGYVSDENTSTKSIKALIEIQIFHKVFFFFFTYTYFYMLPVCYKKSENPGSTTI